MRYSFKSKTTLLLLALWTISVVFVVFSSRAGVNAVEIQSGDFALHMIAVEGYYHTATLVSDSQEALQDVADMSTYPRWSHAIVGYSAAALGISPLQAIQLWGLIILMTGCLILALRMVLSLDEQHSLGAIIVGVVFLLICSYIGFGLSGHIERNFFFPQLFGTVLAMGCLLLLQRNDLDVLIAGGLIFLVGGICLPNIHLLPAIWFTLAALIHGVLIVTVPQHIFLWSKLDAIVKHKRRYSRRELEVKLQENGFGISYATSFLFVLFPLMLISRLFDKGRNHSQSDEVALEKRVKFPNALNWIFDLFMRIDEALIRLGISLPIGGTLVVVAKKR